MKCFHHKLNVSLSFSDYEPDGSRGLALAIRCQECDLPFEFIKDTPKAIRMDYEGEDRSALVASIEPMAEVQPYAH